MSSPPKPPYGELIEEARVEARLSKREAARRAGISDAWWRYVTEGRQGETPVPGTAETVAAMARVVGLTPDRLETEGERPDAADILRGLLRSASAAPPAASPRNPFASVMPDEPGDDAAWKMFPDPADRVLRAIWRMPIPYEEREQRVAELREWRDAALRPPGRESAGLSVPDGNDPDTDLKFR